MDIKTHVFKSVSWIASFKFIGQIVSWATTIIVARILVPDDYGLMSMATVITGYAMLFSELGLGAAIIQKENVSEEEISTIFWFLLFLSLLFMVFCWFIAYPTAWIFNEPKVIPITRMVSVCFLISGLQIVPFNLLKKELKFKQIGFIEVMSVFVSCAFMYVWAKLGFGVWTLIGGNIVKGGVKLVLFYYISRWRPVFCFNFIAVKTYLHFGMIVALSESFFYAYSRSDTFFAGRAWSAGALGLYTFALTLSSLPTQKIVVLVNQVSFPAFSKLKNDRVKFNEFYLTVVKWTAALTLPMFVGGYLVADDLVYVLLDEKWYPMVFVFKMLCLVQILTAINAVNNFVHTAQGRPSMAFYNNALLAVVMPVSFFFSTKHGFNAILIPWFSGYLIICLCWIGITLKHIGIGLFAYARVLWPALCATLVMAMAISGVAYLFRAGSHDYYGLTLKIAVGAMAYTSSILLIDRNVIINFITFRTVS